MSSASTPREPVTSFDMLISPLSPVPVLAIDGPTASGKGTIAQRVAQALGFHYLDSGALYRLTALASARAGLNLDDASAVQPVAVALDVHFSHDGHILLAGQDVTEAIRTEAAGQGASRVAVHPPCAPRCSSCSATFASPRGWWRMAVTWARWSFRMHRSRSS